MKIIVSIKNVYGKELIYPVCSNAVFFSALAGAKTLTPKAIQLIKTFGYTIEVETPSLGGK